MKAHGSCWGYGFIMVLAVALDRVTKALALRYLEDSYHLTSFLSFDLVMNRGISWSLLHSASAIVFGIVSLLIAVIIGTLTIYTVQRWYAGYTILGEVLTLAGAISNFVDRIMYGGVIDFILFSYNAWSFPVFNVADCFIVVGIGMMFISLYEA